MKRFKNHGYCLSILVLALCFHPAPLHAEPYFDAAAITPALLTPPLTPESEARKAEIEAIVALQAHAPEAEVKKALDERTMSPELITLAVDPGLKRTNFPALYTLLDRVADTTHPISDQAKEYWRTVRPYKADKRIKILVKAHTNNAYPSGHTTGAYAWAHTLSLVIPDKRAAFLARAEEIAQHRVLVGMHYPHDLAGGKELALLSIGALMVNPAFRADVEKAKAEYAVYTKQLHGKQE